jgi:hypothetical protein
MLRVLNASSKCAISFLTKEAAKEHERQQTGDQREEASEKERREKQTKLSVADAVAVDENVLGELLVFVLEGVQSGRHQLLRTLDVFLA